MLQNTSSEVNGYLVITVVIVNRHDYLNKMKQLISDGTKFKLLSHNPIKSRENSLISYLRGWYY